MVAPDFSIWSSDGVTEYSAYSWGVGAKNTTTAEVTLYIWNDKGAVSGSDTADNVTITTKTTSNEDTGSTLVEDDWYEVKCTSFGDVAFSAVGGATTKAIGYAAADQTVPSDEKAIVVNQINVPLDVVGGVYEFLLRLDFDY